MSEKKCRVCDAPAEWEWEGERYCEDCLGIELDIYEAATQYRCEQCGAPFKGSYFTEDNNVFCSRKCALEYYGAKKLEEEQEEQADDE